MKKGTKRNNSFNNHSQLNLLPTTGDFKHYYGIYIGYGVKIPNFEEGIDLYNRGCYGKGTLSRSNPSYRLFKQQQLLDQQQQQEIDKDKPISGVFHLKSLKRYKEHTTTTDKIDKLNNNKVEPSLKYQKISNEVLINSEECKIENNSNIDTLINDNNKENKDSNNSNNDEIEEIQLSLYEAFYLFYGLGCLTILRYPTSEEISNYNQNLKNQGNTSTESKKIMTLMSIEECWKLFNEEDDKFLQNYIAYHHFRSTGWIPRSGLKYGCDFVLYKLRPELIHAQFQVIVQLLNNNESNNESNNQDDKVMQLSDSWVNLGRMNRVSETVAKGTIIFNIVRINNNIINNSNIVDALPTKREITDDEGSDHENSKKFVIDLDQLENNNTIFQIECWATKRWTPSKTR